MCKHPTPIELTSLEELMAKRYWMLTFNLVVRRCEKDSDKSPKRQKNFKMGICRLSKTIKKKEVKAF